MARVGGAELLLGHRVQTLALRFDLQLQDLKTTQRLLGDSIWVEAKQDGMIGLA
jgi:hypothetical protein